MFKIIGFYNMSDFYKEDCMCCGKKTSKKIFTFEMADTYICENSCIFSVSKIDTNKLYTPEVLTEDVLKLIEPVVNSKFTYGDELDKEELGNIITETVDDVAENS